VLGGGLNRFGCNALWAWIAPRPGVRSAQDYDCKCLRARDIMIVNAFLAHDVHFPAFCCQDRTWRHTFRYIIRQTACMVATNNTKEKAVACFLNLLQAFQRGVLLRGNSYLKVVQKVPKCDVTLLSIYNSDWSQKGKFNYSKNIITLDV